MRNVKRVISLALIAVFSLALCANALALAEMSGDFYVADHADALSPAMRDKIIVSNADTEFGLEARCDGAQIVVVTVGSLGGVPADEYASGLLADWGVGSASRGNGMLLLFVPGGNEASLAVGSGLRSYWTAGRIENLLDEHFWPEFRAGHYDAAADNTLQELFSWFIEEYGLTHEGPYGGGAYINVPVYAGDGGNLANFRGSRWATNIFYGFFVTGVLLIITLVILMAVVGDKYHHNLYYSSMGRPAPKYRLRYLFSARYRTHRVWWKEHGSAYMNRGNTPYKSRQGSDSGGSGEGKANPDGGDGR